MAVQLTASQEGLSSMELVRSFISIACVMRFPLNESEYIMTMHVLTIQRNLMNVSQNFVPVEYRIRPIA
jgi:hypothetical protein